MASTAAPYNSAVATLPLQRTRRRGTQFFRQRIKESANPSGGSPAPEPWFRFRGWLDRWELILRSSQLRQWINRTSEGATP